VRLEDLTGGVQVVAFPGVFDKASQLITPDAILLVKGRADLRGRELQLVALEIGEPDLGGEEAGAGGGNGRAGNGSDPLLVDLPASACTDNMIARLKSLLALYPGSLPVVLRLVGDDGATRLRIGDGWRVNGSAALLGELRRLFGERAVRFVVEESAAVS
jgi:DNA polymerase III subunit alpha